MAEGARLESVFRGNSNVGSNPTLSARLFELQVGDASLFLSSLALGGWPSLSRFLRKLGMFTRHKKGAEVNYNWRHVSGPKSRSRIGHGAVFALRYW